MDSAGYHDQYLANIELWRDANPEMMEPLITLACFDINRAWFSRGSGYSDSLSEKGWEGFQKYLAQARERLESAPAIAKEDPYYYVALLTINLGEGSSLEEMQGVFEEGQNKHPRFVDLYYEMTRCLQPKWRGEEFSDWGKWLNLALKDPKLSKEDVLVIYGTIVSWNIDYRNYVPIPEGIHFYDFYGVDKKRFMEGLAACCKRYDGSSSWPSSYFYHACMAGDEAAIKEALEMMDFKFDGRIMSAEEFFNLLNKVEEVYPDALPRIKE